MNRDVVKTIVNRCLGYKKGERLLLVCDDKLHRLAYGFYRTARLLGIDVLLLEMPPRTVHGEEPPAAIASALQQTDAALLLTSVSLSHTKARKIASSRYGTRIASLPGITEAIFNRCIRIDYNRLREHGRRISGLFTKGSRVEVTTESGTHLVMSVKGRRGFSDDGFYIKKGAFGNLPAGEVCVGPCEGTTSGRLIVDGSTPLTGRLRRPIEILIKDGYATDVPLAKMKPLVKSLGKGILNIAELGVGLNPKAKVTGNVLEDEKAVGTAHIAFGNNISFGGTVACPCHLDFVFFGPKVKIDGVEIKFPTTAFNTNE